MEEQIQKLLKNDIKEINYTSNSIEDTKRIAFLFAKYAPKDLVLALDGELGSGKTTFMQGFATYFNIEDEVSSPTFTIVNEYSNSIYHFDTYRLKNEEDFLNSIGDDYFNNGICIIEWSEIIKNILPRRTVFIKITKVKENNTKRLIEIWRK